MTNRLRKKHPRSAIEGLRGRGVKRDGQLLVACPRCFREVPALRWPWHGLIEEEACVTIWERRANEKRAA